MKRAKLHSIVAFDPLWKSHRKVCCFRCSCVIHLCCFPYLIQTLNPATSTETLKVTNSPSKMSNNKHIIPKHSIDVNNELGQGEFGVVQRGVWTNGTDRVSQYWIVMAQVIRSWCEFQINPLLIHLYVAHFQIQVAIKRLCRDRMQSNPMEFLKEAAIMHSIEHENIVRLYGVVLDTEALMLVTELAHLRSLLECLEDHNLRVSFLTVPTLCEFTHQICNGMMYLESKRLIHRYVTEMFKFSFSKLQINFFFYIFFYQSGIWPLEIFLSSVRTR